MDGRHFALFKEIKVNASIFCKVQIPIPSGKGNVAIAAKAKLYKLPITFDKIYGINRIVC